MTPEVTLAHQAGLVVNRGIVVDRHLKTSADDIYAVGDVCEFPGVDGVATVMESWANAEAQAACVARSMLGGLEVFEPASWMWSDQFDHTLQMTGRCTNAASVATRRLSDGQLEFYLDADQRIVGAAGFATSSVLLRAFSIARRLVDMKAVRPATYLADPDCNLKSLLAG